MLFSTILELSRGERASLNQSLTTDEKETVTNVTIIQLKKGIPKETRGSVQAVRQLAHSLIKTPRGLFPVILDHVILSNRFFQ